MGNAPGFHLFCCPEEYQERIARRRPGAPALGARFRRASARPADLSRRRHVWTRNVVFHPFDDFFGVRAVCGRDRALHQRDTRERFHWKMGYMVAHWSAWRPFPSFFVRASASKRSSTRVERDRRLAYGAMGCMGRPASAMRHGSIGNTVSFTCGSPGFTGTTGPAGHPSSIVK